MIDRVTVRFYNEGPGIERVCHQLFNNQSKRQTSLLPHCFPSKTSPFDVDHAALMKILRVKRISAPSVLQFEGEILIDFVSEICTDDHVRITTSYEVANGQGKGERSMGLTKGDGRALCKQPRL